MKEIAARHNVMAGVVAIAWTLHHPAITAAIVGGRNMKQVESILPAATFQLSDAEYEEINAFIRAQDRPPQTKRGGDHQDHRPFLVATRRCL